MLWTIFAIALPIAILWRLYNRSQAIPLSSGMYESNGFTVAVWTIHFGYSNAGAQNFYDLATALRWARPDVIALIETDLARVFKGNRDIVEYLAEDFQMYADYGPSTRQHTWGCALLSRYPLKNVRHHLLPSPQGELAPGLDAILDVGGTEVALMMTHMGNERDWLDRQLQAEFIAKLAAELKDYPQVFLGYITSAPGQPNYQKMLSTGLKDMQPEEEDRWCEYIFYNKVWPVGYARIDVGHISDTELQMAKFRLPAVGLDDKLCLPGEKWSKVAPGSAWSYEIGYPKVYTVERYQQPLPAAKVSSANETVAWVRTTPSSIHTGVSCVQAYRAFLGRPADPEGGGRYAKSLETDDIRPLHFKRILFDSSEGIARRKTRCLAAEGDREPFWEEPEAIEVRE